MSQDMKFDVTKEVMTRYGAGAKEMEAELCCPTEYDPQFLKAIPTEVIERDYGCGDPSKWVEHGQVVVDLGSGGGKDCFIIAQKVGQKGRVIGVDLNDDMLALARQAKETVAANIGYDNVQFVKGKIQDLALDLESVESWLKQNPVSSVEAMSAFESHCDQLRRTRPMVASDSVDVVVSSCVLNLVRNHEKKTLFNEIFRVLKRGGQAVISDIVCDETPTQKIMDDPELWSGCISGAFEEEQFLQMFVDAGFYGVEILERQEKPWRTIDGVEFRSMTVRAFKGKQGPCFERNQAVVYLGPWKQVVDDDGHVLPRGRRMAVCDKTYRIMTNPNGPYAGQLAAIDPLEDIPLEDAKPFDCRRSVKRHPRETKGMDYDVTTEASDDCCPNGGCC